MLFDLEALKGMKLQARDGEIGKCVDFLFDDQYWTVRYMDARAGNWLTGRRVLISPISLREPDWEAGLLPVGLSREQVKDSPSLGEDQPVSREFEREFFRFYGYGYYWMGGAAWGAGVLPSELENRHADIAEQGGEENHLRSLKEVSRYHVISGDKDIGKLDALLVDDADWAVPYLVVDTGTRLSHNRVVVPASWFADISWSDRSLQLQAGRGQLESAPEYRGGAPVALEDASRYRRFFNRAPA